MPRMVTAGRAHSMSETLPPARSDTPSSTPASLRNCSGGYGAPVQVWVLSSPVIVVLPWSSRSVASMATSAASASGAGPPNMPECTSDASASTVTTTLTMPAQAHGRGRDADGGVAGVADQDRVGAQQVGVLRDEVLEPAGALLLRALDDQLEVDRHVVAERAQRGQVHDDVALAVGGAAAVPAAVDLGQLERRGPPGVLVERRLHVVVGVEQHGRGVRVGARPGADHRLAAVGGLARGGRRRSRARRTCRAPTGRRARTPPAGTGGRRRPTGSRRARPAPSRACGISSATRSRRSMSRHCPPRRRRSSGCRRTAGSSAAGPGSRS